MSNTGVLRGVLSAPSNLSGKIKANGVLTGRIEIGKYDNTDDYASDADIEALFAEFEEE